MMKLVEMPFVWISAMTTHTPWLSGPANVVLTAVAATIAVVLAIPFVLLALTPFLA
jgi:hypothetical protein